MENYLYENKNSLSLELCNHIIYKFELENKNEGVTTSGLNKNVKDTDDFTLPCPNTDGWEKWSRINNFLQKEIEINVKEYLNILTNNVEKKNKIENSTAKFNILTSNFLSNNTFLIQRYIKNQGRYVYHNDFACNFTTRKYRVITFIFYLNTIDEGGETEFWGTYKVKPEAGKLILFPATWTFPHRGMMPISSNKYIITGWLYMHE